MPDRSTAGLVLIVAGLIPLTWGVLGLVQKTVPHLARARVERLTSIDDNVYTSVKKDETKNTSYNTYWLAVGGGFALIAGGLGLATDRGHYFDFRVTKAPKGLKKRKVEYRDYPKIGPDELDERGRYIIK